MIPMPVHADELGAVQQLIRAGKLQDALTEVNALITSNPKDPQYHFLRGIILADQRKTQEAIEVFTQLTEQYPELPEPYNNLAVLYAQRGDYEKARAALDMAIRTNPNYATAYENLGDVYAKLASQSYQKALQLNGNKGDATRAKLALIRQLLSNRPEPQSPATPAEAPHATAPAHANSDAAAARQPITPAIAARPASAPKLVAQPSAAASPKNLTGAALDLRHDNTAAGINPVPPLAPTRLSRSDAQCLVPAACAVALADPARNCCLNAVT
ncbi:MAG: tetratricopeptide repeat protein [Proteobacteria bacterium]|nr:tetratricopeptide repeat protein [Pseudomonadota bacterium]